MGCRATPACVVRGKELRARYGGAAPNVMDKRYLLARRTPLCVGGPRHRECETGAHPSLAGVRRARACREAADAAFANALPPRPRPSSGGTQPLAQWQLAAIMLIASALLWVATECVISCNRDFLGRVLSRADQGEHCRQSDAASRTAMARVGGCLNCMKNAQPALEVASLGSRHRFATAPARLHRRVLLEQQVDAAPPAPRDDAAPPASHHHAGNVAVAPVPLLAARSATARGGGAPRCRGRQGAPGLGPPPLAGWRHQHAQTGP